MANSDVKLKHKVQLRKKVEEAVGEQSQEPEAPKSNRLWILGGVVVLALGVIAYLLFFGSGKKTSSSVNEDGTEVVEEVATNETDTVAAAPAEETVGPKATEPAPETPEASSQEAAPDATVSSQQNNTATPASKTQTVGVSNDVEAEAMKVIRGDYGVGQERKDRLGDKYQPIQNRVNELKREGVF